MKIITVWVSMGLVGSDRETEIEVEDDANDNQIEDAAREAMFEMIEWGWSSTTSPSEPT